MEYIIIDDIKKLVMIGVDVNSNSIISSTPPTEIIWDEGLRVEGWLEDAVHDELFIGRGRVSISLCKMPLGSFFNSNS